MRKTEEILGDWQDVVTSDGSTQELEAATVNLVKDIPDLLDALEAKDEDIQGLETVLSAGQMIVCQQNATIGNLHEDLAEKDAEIEQLREIAQLADTLTTRLIYDLNVSLSDSQAEIAYGPETSALTRAIGRYKTIERDAHD